MNIYIFIILIILNVVIFVQLVDNENDLKDNYILIHKDSIVATGIVNFEHQGIIFTLVYNPWETSKKLMKDFKLETE